MTSPPFPASFPRTTMTIVIPRLLSAGAAAGLLLLTGCVTTEGVKNPSGVPVTEMRPDERGFVAGTGIESQDLVTVTDRMARSILGIPQIAHAQAAPSVVLEPVVKIGRAHV